MNIDLTNLGLGRYNKFGAAIFGAVATQLDIEMLPDGRFLVSPPASVEELLLVCATIGGLVFLVPNKPAKSKPEPMETFK